MGVSFHVAWQRMHLDARWIPMDWAPLWVGSSLCISLQANQLGCITELQTRGAQGFMQLLDLSKSQADFRLKAENHLNLSLGVCKNIWFYVVVLTVAVIFIILEKSRRWIYCDWCENVSFLDVLIGWLGVKPWGWIGPESTQTSWGLYLNTLQEQGTDPDLDSFSQRRISLNCFWYVLFFIIKFCLSV